MKDPLVRFGVAVEAPLLEESKLTDVSRSRLGVVAVPGTSSSGLLLFVKVGVDSDCAPTTAAAARTTVPASSPSPRDLRVPLLVMTSTLPSVGPARSAREADETPGVERPGYHTGTTIRQEKPHAG